MSRKFFYKYSFLLVVCLCLVGCKGELVDEYCHHTARFLFNFQNGHTQSYLYAALNSSDYFVFVSTNPIDGGGFELITEAYGNEEKNVERVTEANLTKNGRALG